MPKWEHFKGTKLDHPRKWPSSDWEVMQRVALVSQMIIQWYSRTTILANIMDKYDLSESAVNEYMRKAKEHIRAKNDETLEDELEIVQARITDMYQWARKEKKYSDVWKAIKLHMELKWLEAPKKYQEIPISDEDRKKVDRLMAINMFWEDENINDLSITS